MLRAFGGVGDGLVWPVSSEAVVEVAGYGAAPGAPGFGFGHETRSVCTRLKGYSAYTGSEAMA